MPYVPLGGTPQPIVRTLLNRLGLKRPFTGYVGVGEALIAGPNAFTVTLDWAGVGYRLLRTRNLRESAIPLIEAHRIDGAKGVYSKMVADQERRCAGQGHAECRAALG